MVKGFLTICKFTDESGKEIPTQKAVDYGWVKPASNKPSGWGFEREEIPIGSNMFVDNGRQILAYLFGARTPAGSYVCSRFGVGTGANPNTSGMTDLQSPANFYNAGSGPLLATKPITGVDYPVPFIARVQFQLATTEANGLLLSEFGLYCMDMNGGGTTLLARKTCTPVPKQSGFAPVWLWRIRF
jgi:hypothetical protein